MCRKGMLMEFDETVHREKSMGSALIPHGIKIGDR
jgi:hypothetical protein